MTKKKQKKARYKSKYPKKFQAGGAGMYSDNTVMSAGQGGAGSTSNIVYDESNPTVLNQKLQFLEDTKTKLQNTNQQVADQVAADEEQAKVDIENAAAESEQKTNVVGNTIGTTIKSAQKFDQTLLNKGKDKVKDAVSNPSKASVGAMHAYKAQRAANLGIKATAGNASGMNLITNTAKAAKAVKALPEGAQIMSSAKTGKTIVVDAGGNIIKGGASSIGASIGAAAKNPNVLAAVANIGGKAIKHFSDDDDATTWNTGEATGDILGTAGEYAGYGAMLTSWLGPGAGIGAAVGGIVGAGVGIYKGLTGRNKARKQEREAAAKKAEKVKKYNTEVKSDLMSATQSARGAEINAKTYSGYDLGRNVVAKYGGARYKKGGMKMGTPRYGYAS